jgi:type II secretory pathway component PulK
MIARRTARGKTAWKRRGTVLVVAIVLSVALVGLTLTLGRSMRVEMIASANYAAGLQASTIERGAEQYLLAMLVDQEGDLSSVTEEEFEAISIGDGYFWVLRPDYNDSSLPAFGLLDESSKLNINVATYDQLLVLPSMTDEAAAAIVDWHDEDSDLTDGGAEEEYYLGLEDAYYCKNSSFESVEELSLVRGMTADLLYGDGSGTTVLGRKSSRTVSGKSALQDAWLQRGIHDLVTVYGTEPTTALDGTQRVSVSNREELQQLLVNQLGSSRAAEILAAAGEDTITDVFDLYVRGKMTSSELSEITDYISSASTTASSSGTGGSGSASGGTGGDASSGAGSTGASAGTGGSSGSAAGGSGGSAGTSSGSSSGTSGTSSGSGTSSSQSQASGQINVNTAPREVLLAIPELDSSDVDMLISRRSSQKLSGGNPIGWVADVLGDKAVGLAKRITGRSNEWSALILAASGNGRGFRYVRIIIDMSTPSSPQIKARYDLTDRGWPMDPRILASLRAGQAPNYTTGRSRLGSGDLSR